MERNNLYAWGMALGLKAGTTKAREQVIEEIKERAMATALLTEAELERVVDVKERWE